MRVRRVPSLSEPALVAAWSALDAGGIPFRSHKWLAPWWQSYHTPSTDLYVLGCWDGAELVALLPLYRARSGLYGRCLRLLGDGEACSEYQGMLCLEGAESAAATAFAAHLIEAGSIRSRARQLDEGWDLMDLGALDPEDPAMGALFDALGERGAAVARWAGPRCWRVRLPPSFDEYLAMLSQSHRRQLRRIVRTLDGERRPRRGRSVPPTSDPSMPEGPEGPEVPDAMPAATKLRWARSAVEVAELFRALIGLHQARRTSLGDSGTFASPRFTEFLSTALLPLFDSGRLWLSAVEIEGRPVAVDCHLIGCGTVYAYICGNAVEALRIGPGRVARAGAIRRAIAEGYSTYDFVRGDEPYKAHFRARPYPTLRALISSARPAARVHHRLLVAGRSARAVLRDLRTVLRPPPSSSSPSLPPGDAQGAAPND